MKNNITKILSVLLFSASFASFVVVGTSEVQAHRRGGGGAIRHGGAVHRHESPSVRHSAPSNHPDHPGGSSHPPNHPDHPGGSSHPPNHPDHPGGPSHPPNHPDHPGGPSHPPDHPDHHDGPPPPPDHPGGPPFLPPIYYEGPIIYYEDPIFHHSSTIRVNNYTNYDLFVVVEGGSSASIERGGYRNFDVSGGDHTVKVDNHRGGKSSKTAHLGGGGECTLDFYENDMYY